MGAGIQGLIRAEGLTVTSVAAGDKLVIQQRQTSGVQAGQFLPRLVTYANFIAGGGTGLDNNAVVYTSSTGDLETDTTFFTYVGASTHLLTVKNVSIGASGVVGSLSIFPTTAAKGKWLVSPVDNTGNTTMTLTNAAQSGAWTYTIPDAGASASFMLTAGNQTATGNNTFSTGTTQINTLNIGASGTVGSMSLFSTTAAKGKWLFTPVDNTGNTTMTITNTAQSGAFTYTIPDGKAACSFVLQNKGTGTEAANAVTISNLCGVITTSSLNTAGGASYLITLTNTYIASTSVVLATYNGGTNTTRNITIACVPGSGTAAITIYNNTAATALNGTVIIDFIVIP